MTSELSSSKHAASYAEGEGIDARFCEYTLRKVLSWLDVPDLMQSAALVSTRWAAASSCKELWRRRMHQQVLNTLFSSAHQQQQRQQDQTSNIYEQQQQQEVVDQSGGQQLLQQQQQGEQDVLTAAVAAMAAVRMSPARLFAGLYAPNLLTNGSFLERLNSHKGSSRRTVWEATFNARGMTWAHPFDFFPELCPLPEEEGSAANTKPFSIGCLATASGAWSEVVQVVDLQAVLTSQGIPADTVTWLLTAGLPLEFSVYVAGGAQAGGEYQIVFTLVSAADAATAANNQVPLSAVPKLTLPFGHPPPGSAGIDAVSAANLRARGFSEGSKTLAKTPLHPAPGIWSRYACRMTLPKATPISHVVIGLRGRASRNSRLGHYATKFAAAQLKFVTADICPGNAGSQ